MGTGRRITCFGAQDFEYTIEARVTDASRREVVGSGTVRVSRQRYFAFARPLHQLYRPGDEVRVELKTQDANEQPLAAEGRVRVTRERWVEIWVDPAGREVGGFELDKVRRREAVFPPPPRRPPTRSSMKHWPGWARKTARPWCCGSSRTWT